MVDGNEARVFFVLIICIAILIWIALQFSTINLHTEVPKTVVSQTPARLTVKSYPTISVEDASYTYAVINVATASSITLIPNFIGKHEANALAGENNCRQAINGGFYDASGKPLGFFYTNGRTYGKRIDSDLVNGYFWADTDGVAVISTELPGNISYRFALESGPLLLFNGQTTMLTIQNDEHARRMVAAKTADDHSVFLAVYSHDSVFSGPLLSELPKIVEDVSGKEHLGIADALNLDGGSASAFYNVDTILSELSPVGSIFCIK